MKADIKVMMDCEGIVLLPYFFISNGASRESDIAEMLAYERWWAFIGRDGDWMLTDDPNEAIL
jgi:hypothetical protein